MKRFLMGLMILILTSFTAAPVVAGQVQISLVPSSSKIHIGDNLFVDINISGLQSGGVDNLLGAWSLDLHYDSNLFVPLLVAPAGFGSQLGDTFALEALGTIDISTPGTIGLSLVSLLSNAELDALQRGGGNLLDGFRLATVGLFAPLDLGYSGGSTALFTSNIVLSDALGNPLADANGVPLPVQHLPVGILVPEPATLALVMLGLVGALAPKSRRRSAVAAA